MAFRASAAMALCFLFSLVAIARSIPLEEAGLTTNASSAAVTAAEVHAAPDGEGEGLLLLPYSDDSVVPAAVETVVAEPDPDRSLPSSEVEGEEEELVDNKLQAAQVEQGGEKTEEQIDDDEDDGDEEEQEKLKKKNKDKDKEKEKQKDKQKKKDKEKKKDKDKDKEKKKDKEKEKDKEKDKEKQKQKKKDKDKRKEKDKDKEKEKEKRKDKDENEQEEEKERWWRKKAISRSMFGHGRRSQREEAAKEEVKN